MVNLDNFEIHLSRQNGVFYSGEEISGNLLIRSRNRHKINAIYLEFKGEACVDW